MKHRCLHSWKFTGKEPHGEDRVIHHFSCRNCPATKTRNVKKPRYVPQKKTFTKKAVGVPKLRKTLQKAQERKRSGIRPVSEKRRKQNAEYSRLRKLFLEDHPICQFQGCRQPSTECHHKRGREGRWLTDVTEFMAICRPHHDWIEVNREESFRLQYLKLRITTNQLKNHE